MIDYSFGRYNIHSYTIEVYSPGKSESGDINDCMWENNMPEAKWVFYAYDEIQEKLGLDPAAITDEDGNKLAANEGLWFYTSSSNQMVNDAPEEQDVMVRGCRDAILTMIHSEIPTAPATRTPASTSKSKLFQSTLNKSYDRRETAGHNFFCVSAPNRSVQNLLFIL